ncbi:MarR family winged helix-turn-helix transcriptional regulator [Sanguibacter suaedae]|uniref:Winged helix-turn-helix transcriptional regulator n=1 Tax=Sanguibacter suaedae TaxID=2795737 RepID=A0A934ID79_9MICO|nr:MarR family winged helix-turn-helix transcriptional regulator [Sanguibacter suaedae]MBI9115605.1 winged helix-turn-helix transcriptional regulator [Sanguibacter suaedae]
MESPSATHPTDPGPADDGSTDDGPTGTSSPDTWRATDIDWDAAGIETELGWSLQAVYQGFSRVAQGAVAPVPGGPRGYQVLVAITTEDASSQLALAHRLGIDKTAMTYVVDALEGAGLVERRPDPTDRRVRQVHATKAGRALLETARRDLRAVEGTLMRGLALDEQTLLRHLLARVALGADQVEACVPAAETQTSSNQPVAAPDRSRRTTHPTSRD